MKAMYCVKQEYPEVFKLIQTANPSIKDSWEAELFEVHEILELEGHLSDNSAFSGNSYSDVIYLLKKRKEGSILSYRFEESRGEDSLVEITCRTEQGGKDQSRH